MNQCMYLMFSIFLKTSRSRIQSIRTIVQPIRDDIFKHKKSFYGNLMDKNKDEYVSAFLLSLTSMLVDGYKNTEKKCSQVALTAAGLIMYYIRLWSLQNLPTYKFGNRLFCCAAKDNIDRNATANLFQSHFHGSCILLFQVLDHEKQGESLDCHRFIDAVYNIKKLVCCSSEELFIPLCRFNYEFSEI